MASPPSSALAGTAVSAVALAGVVDTLARTLPVPAPTAQAAIAKARYITVIAAPGITTLGDVAAVAAGLIGAVQALARDAAPADASAGLYAAAAATQACAPTSASPALTQAYALARALCVGVEAACLGEAFLAEARTDFADRQSAVAARQRIAVAMDGATDRVAAALGQATLDTLNTAARQASTFLMAELATLRPIARVRTARSMPAMALAWALYRNPARATELVARNRVATPFFMPTILEAVTPDAN
ncbi:hypothetical protein MFUR16E_04755 [Methylobacterium fujisawaense]|uniref:hypothetical protein n=1 Tax=Methylobacterium fujisawaense TaxID=107400 RepID=UPI002F2D883E